MKRPLLLVGAGRMGGALLRGWIGRGVGGPIDVVEPLPAAWLRRLARNKQITLHKHVPRASGKWRACVIGLKPQILSREMVALKAVADSRVLMISIAAGISSRALRESWGVSALIIRAMPNILGAIGRGISALYATQGTTADERKLAEALLSAIGEVVWVRREHLIDSVTAVSGSGPAYVFLLVEALAEAAEAEGLSRPLARKFARATVVGAGALLEADKREPAALRLDVTSPGGTTQAALDILLGEQGLKPLIARAVHAARRRAEELGS